MLNEILLIILRNLAPDYDIYSVRGRETMCSPTLKSTNIVDLNILDEEYKNNYLKYAIKL
jgi:hypothetical protein